MFYFCIVILLLTYLCDAIFCDEKQDSQYYYEVLGISPSAGPKEINKAYKTLVMKYHPDKNDSDEAKEMFLKVIEARNALLYPEKNRGSFGAVKGQEYEQRRKAFSFNFGDPLEDLFGQPSSSLFSDLVSRLRSRGKNHYFTPQTFFDEKEPYYQDTEDCSADGFGGPKTCAY